MTHAFDIKRWGGGGMIPAFEDYVYLDLSVGGQWLSGRVLHSRPRGRGFEPHQHHWVVVFEQDTFILA